MWSETLFKIISEAIRKQGLSFILLGAITYFFYLQLEGVKEEFRSCNAEVIRLHDERNKEMMELIIQNRELIARNTAAFESFSYKQNQK